MPKTLIIVILDESGSMDTKKADVLGGFNNFIAETEEGGQRCSKVISC